VAAYLVGVHPGGGGASGAAAAVAAVPGSHAMAMLEQERQQMIDMTAASQTLTVVGTPKVASRTPPSQGASDGGSAGSAGVNVPPAPPPDPGTAQSIAYKMLPQFGFSAATQYSCLNNIWSRESGWRYNAENPIGAYGIPQALPASKMASAGADYLTNPATQITWGLGYIKGRYGTPCAAWAFWQNNGFY